MALVVGGLRPQAALAVPDDLVFHVGDVHAVADLVARALQGALEQVLEQEGAQVADVGEVVDRGSAGVDRHQPRGEGLKFLDLPVEGVVKGDRPDSDHT